MPTEQQKKKTAQTLLQTAQDPGKPQNMMRILGLAGEGIADFASKAYENLVPQSVEELAMEGSPAGKAIGTAIGLIPPKYIRPLIERLKGRVSQQFADPVQRQIIEQQINRNPHVAGHLTDIRPISANDRIELELPDATGFYRDFRRSPLDTDDQAKQLLADPTSGRAKLLEEMLDPKFKGNWWGGEIGIDNTIPTGTFQDVLRHEFNHGAQDIAGQLPKLKEWTDNIPYTAQPQEIGSRISEARGRWLRDPANKGRPFDYAEAMEAELNGIEHQLKLAPEQYPAFNESMMYMNEQLKPKGLKIGVQQPANILGVSQSLSPARKFKLEKIVLDR
jgi:hypothetical protein